MVDQDTIQIQEQKLEQQQLLKINQQQLLSLQLLEMPIARLEEEVEAIIDENPALEKDYDMEMENGLLPEKDDNPETDYEQEENIDNNEEYQDELTRALDDLSRDDTLDSFDIGNEAYSQAEYEEKGGMAIGDSTSFYDNLVEQMGQTDLTDEERTIMEYIIGSLDTDGLLRKSLDQISDELAIYEYVEVDEKKILEVLQKLQKFEPAGIGARSLQECLILQIDRMPPSYNRQLMREVIRDHFEAFTMKHWNEIQENFELSDDKLENLIFMLRKLNPKPGAALGEVNGRSTNLITPDIIIEKDEDGRISFSINRGNLPELKISSDYDEEMQAYERLPQEKLSSSAREAMNYYREKIEKAKSFIEAIRMRYRTMTVCTKEIIRWQLRYFNDGDETELRPMLLRDIAEKTGLDISTISRFSNQKYADTPWGIKPMRFFFSESYTTDDGDVQSARTVKLKLKDIIDNENKKKPLSDEALTKKMAEAGFPIARRTVAKYREQLNIPVARLRK